METWGLHPEQIDVLREALKDFSAKVREDAEAVEVIYGKSKTIENGVMVTSLRGQELIALMLLKRIS
jgi:citrate lyase beta subunit